MGNELPAIPHRTTGISVVIPSHNRPALLQEALSSALDQTVLPTEIIIVDASDPPVSLQARRDGVPLRLLRRAGTRGAAGKRIGAQAARGKVIAFPDDDDL